MLNERFLRPEYAEAMWDFVHVPFFEKDFLMQKEKHNISIAQYVCFFRPLEFEKFLETWKQKP